MDYSALLTPCCRCIAPSLITLLTLSDYVTGSLTIQLENEKCPHTSIQQMPDRPACLSRRWTRWRNFENSGISTTVNSRDRDVQDKYGECRCRAATSVKHQISQSDAPMVIVGVSNRVVRCTALSLELIDCFDWGARCSRI